LRGNTIIFDTFYLHQIIKTLANALRRTKRGHHGIEIKGEAIREYRRLLKDGESLRHTDLRWRWGGITSMRAFYVLWRRLRNGERRSFEDDTGAPLVACDSVARRRGETLGDSDAVAVELGLLGSGEEGRGI